MKCILKILILIKKETMLSDNQSFQYVSKCRNHTFLLLNITIYTNKLVVFLEKLSALIIKCH